MITIKSLILENTNNFKKWFGKSKVKKGNKPLIMYHGANIDFNIFDINKMRSGWLSTGFYFTNNKTEASDYGSKILRVYLRLEKPFIIKGDTINGDGSVTFVSSAKEQIYEKYPKLKKIKYKDISKALAKIGYDGIINSNNLICVFSPNNIKSVNNDGSYDLNDNNIYS